MSKPTVKFKAIEADCKLIYADGSAIRFTASAGLDDVDELSLVGTALACGVDGVLSAMASKATKLERAMLTKALADARAKLAALEAKHSEANTNPFRSAVVQEEKPQPKATKSKRSRDS